MSALPEIVTVTYRLLIRAFRSTCAPQRGIALFRRTPKGVSLSGSRFSDPAGLEIGKELKSCDIPVRE
jgi:hypothetical protein